MADVAFEQVSKVYADGTRAVRELVGSVWLLLVSAGARPTGVLPRGACNLGLIAGASSTTTSRPG